MATVLVEWSICLAIKFPKFVFDNLLIKADMNVEKMTWLAFQFIKKKFVVIFVLTLSVALTHFHNFSVSQ